MICLLINFTGFPLIENDFIYDINPMIVGILVKLLLLRLMCYNFGWNNAILSEISLILLLLKSIVSKLLRDFVKIKSISVILLYEKFNTLSECKVTIQLGTTWISFTDKSKVWSSYHCIYCGGIFAKKSYNLFYLKSISWS